MVLSLHSPQMGEQPVMMARFSGSNPDRWLLQAERYFNFHRIRDDDRVTISSFYFDEDAAYWFDWMFRNHQLSSWSAFQTALLQRFRAQHQAEHPHRELPSIASLAAENTRLLRQILDQLTSLVNQIPPTENDPGNIGVAPVMKQECVSGADQVFEDMPKPVSDETLVFEIGENDAANDSQIIDCTYPALTFSFDTSRIPCPAMTCYCIVYLLPCDVFEFGSTSLVDDPYGFRLLLMGRVAHDAYMVRSNLGQKLDVYDNLVESTSIWKVFDKNPKRQTSANIWVGNALRHECWQPTEIFQSQLFDPGIKVRVYCQVRKADQGKFALNVVVKTLELYKGYFAVQYPLPQLDMIAIPDFAAGAMENYGLVTYREPALLYDETHPAAANKQRVATVVAHELAHQWFGNLVTMEWWTHLWLNDGFATWVSYLAADSLFPEWKIWTQFSDESTERLRLDGLEESHPIEVEVNHASEIDEIFDAISYRKGASVIRILQSYLGAENFQRSLASYIPTHAYSHAKIEDLWAALAEGSGEPDVKLFDLGISLPATMLIDSPFSVAFVPTVTSYFFLQQILEFNSYEAHKAANLFLGPAIVDLSAKGFLVFVALWPWGIFGSDYEGFNMGRKIEEPSLWCIVDVAVKFEETCSLLFLNIEELIDADDPYRFRLLVIDVNHKLV